MAERKKETKTNLDAIKITVKDIVESSSDLSVTLFTEVEMTLYLMERFAPDKDVQKAYLLYQNYSLAGTVPETEESFRLAKAKRILRHFSSKYDWNKAIKEYQKISEDYRMYLLHSEIITEKNGEKEIEEKILRLERNKRFVNQPNREPIYNAELLNEKPRKKPEYAVNGTYTFCVKNEENKDAKEFLEVNLPEIDIQTVVSPDPNVPLKRKEPIIVSLEELRQAAVEMKEIIKDDYCLEAMSRNTLKLVTHDEEGYRVTETKSLNIDCITNIVGMVGSGKTNLLKVLSYALAKRKIKTVLILETVPDIFQMVDFFRKRGIEASPVIGRSSISRRIYQVAEESDDCLFLPDCFSQYLTAPCMMMGDVTANKNNIMPRFGEEPCKNLRWVNKNDIENGNTKNLDDKKSICPYIRDCPSHRMDREALTSDIIVTNIHALAKTSISSENMLLLNYVIMNADVVLIDECDKIQSVLDTMFVATTDIDEFRRQADFSDRYNKVSSAVLDRMDKNVKEFFMWAMRATEYSDTIRTAVNRMRPIGKRKKGEWDILRGYFWASPMYQWILSKNKEQNEANKNNVEITDEDIIGFPDNEVATRAIERTLQSAMWETRDPLFSDVIEAAEVFMGDSSSEKGERFEMKLHLWFTSIGASPNESAVEKIKLYLLMTRWEHYIKKLNALYIHAGENETDAQLFKFLGVHCASQQKFLSSFFTGNMFGMRCEGDKGLRLYKMYASGRLLMTKMPWLVLTENGEPAGPHVIMLSGSSYAPGCLQYHVNAPINYILEIDDDKKKKLREIEFYDITNSDIRVSGTTDPDKRMENLLSLIPQNKGFIKNELSECKQNSKGEITDKLLLIVNSYAEAAKVADFINKYKPLNKDLNSVLAACMVGDDSEAGPARIRRSEITKFGRKPADAADPANAKILVAPASAICRGYNITDENGHSTFGSMFLLVRPIPVPDEFETNCAKLIGLVERDLCGKAFNSAFEKADYIREIAFKHLTRMENLHVYGLADLPFDLLLDVTAGIFNLMDQVFGRLCRITDFTRRAPRVYFVDGAFHKAPEFETGYDALLSLQSYVTEMISNPESKEIAEVLYGGICDAFNDIK